MNKANLSLIINTFPPKAEYFDKCMGNLLNQSLSDFEVIVVNDGNDNHTKSIIRKYLKNFQIKYHQRENDNCLSKSRNIGAGISNSENLVFIDSDILLNPEALKNYYQFLNNTNRLSIWGKFGEIKDSLINEKRLPFINPELKKYIENYFFNLIFVYKPFFFAFGANFGITKKLYFDVGGFDENFSGWGHEDIEFAFRLNKNGVLFRFSEEIWGEHLPHERKTTFHNNQSVNMNENKLNMIIEDEYKKYLLIPEEKILGEFDFIAKKLGNRDIFIPQIETYLEERKALVNNFKSSC